MRRFHSQRYLDRGSGARLGPNLELGAERGRALAHAREPEPPRLRRHGRVEADAVVDHAQADPVAVAKVLNDFAKGNEKFVIAGGAMPGQMMSPKEIAALAALPSRDELLAKLLGTMQAPIAKFVRTLNEVPGKFVRTLAALRDKTPAQQASSGGD